ncbi:hypothetical protein K1T71_000773 [Dendrolimus kikuchii]|uniref:Uncharacterized protein n=1 Tax=Dendrolimus kikuchii TaxID=765133 RepID=A0ACC1DKB9_9NEOP|nr:hypothetical protein K1T71_000773 [Dendrolimus kikuchii]
MNGIRLVVILAGLCSCKLAPLTRLVIFGLCFSADLKTLVSLIVSKTCNNDYNYAIEEQHNLECGQKVPERVEEVKKEIEDDEDINIKAQGGKVLRYLDEAVTVKEEELEVDEIDIKEEIEDIIEDNNAESDMVDVKTEILPDDEDTLANRSLEETMQTEAGTVLEKIDSVIACDKQVPTIDHVQQPLCGSGVLSDFLGVGSLTPVRIIERNSEEIECRRCTPNNDAD